MRAWTSQFQTAMQAADPLRPLLLVTLATGLAAPNDVVRICNADAPVTFPDGGNVYTPRPFELGQVRIQSQENPGGTTLAIGDDGYLRGLVNAGAAFENREVEVRLVERSRFDSAAHMQFEVFVVERRPEELAGVFSFALKTLDAYLDDPFPLGTFTKERFKGISDRR